MARFDIISKDGNTIRYSGKPRYSGSYLKPSFLEFSEIASPATIAWEVGDYVDYPRTGMRYRLYSIPQPSKNARKGSYGGAFTYSNVQFHAATKELEIALFRDLVANDNNIHFSTSPDVVTYENVEGIARRIQACMDYFYPGRWEIRMAEFDAVADAEVIEKIATAKDFAMSGGTCLDALSKIYELWEEIGWVHTHENGKEVITIGYANKRIGTNTTDAYLYGKGNGLTAIKKSQTNKDEFATRLYVYGSERNLPHRYYNGKDILNAESVDIRNLMLPLDKWGLTDGLPDARKAYLENAEAVAKYGVIPKTHYFDSDDAGADIYPSIEGMTVGQLRKVLADMGETKYSPDASIYPNDSERVDEIFAAPRMVDDGVLKRNGKEHDIENGWYLFATTTPGTTIQKGTAEKTAVVENHLIKDLDIDSQGIIRAKITFTSDKICTIADADYESVSGVLTLANDADFPSIKEEVGFTFVLNDDGVWEGRLPKVIANYDNASYGRYVAFATMSVYVTPKKATTSDITASVNISDGYVTFIADQLFDKTFQLTLKQIGFDINERATMGEGKVISMKTGMCAGRNFIISECRYVANTDKWVLVCRRQQDDTLGMLFPNKDYQIATDDQFVLLDIALPEVYIGVAQERLLAEGERLLAKASRIQNHYEPMIDAKVMIESGRNLREGMFMEISDEDVIDNGTDYILIDTLSIYEDESAIPTYKVTLREKRKVTYKGTPSATSETSTKSYGENEVASVGIDLSDYATKDYVDSKTSEMGGMFYWADEEHTTIGTKYNFFSEKENSAGGKGEAIGTSGGGGGGIDTGELDDILDSKGYATEKWVEEKGYATKAEIPTKVSQLQNDKSYLTQTAASGQFIEYKEFSQLEERVADLEEGGVGGDLSDYATIQYVDEGLDDKQDKLVSGSNIKTINGHSILGYGNINIGDNGGGGAEGLNAINVNGESFQPDGNGIVTLPDYPSALPNPKALTFGRNTYDGSVAKTITETDIISDINTIRTKLENLENYDDAEVKADIATLEGYFTNGKANDADKLDGKDSTHFAAASSVSNLSGSVTSLGNDMANVKQDISEIENSISDINGDIADITARVTKAEEDISQNKGNIDGIGEDVTSLMAWYNAVGSKFSKDADGTIKMDGDFYTTGENSAGGEGESVGGTGGGIDTEELDYILNGKGYATEKWVNEQGFATGTIPTRVSQLLNDSGYITSADIPDIPDIPDAYTKDEVDNLLDGYTTTLSHNTLVSRVATAEAKITENANGIATNATKIATNAENIGELDERMLSLEEWFVEVGQYFKYDEANEAWYLDGNFYAKGENSANGAGEDIIDFAEVASRVAANETAIKALSASGPNLAINFTLLKGNIGDSKLQTVMNLIGLTMDVVNDLLDAKYNKVVGNGTYREVWNYTAHETASYIEIYLRKGYSDLAGEWYHLHYDRTTQKWNITRGDI